jgi:uncharacterized membrane protein
MLKYLIQVVQNAMPVGILTALVYAAGFAGAGEDRKRRLVCGGAAGIVAALLLAMLRRTTRMVNRELVNIAVLTAAVIAGILFILLIWGCFGKKQNRDGLFGWTGAGLAALLLFYALPTVFLYPAEFLLPGQSVFSTDFLFKLVGFLAGLLIVFLGSLALFKCGSGLAGNSDGAVPAALRSVLTVSLVINMINQIAAIVQFLLARRLISVPRRVFRVLVRIINHNDVFLYALMAASLIVPLILFVRSCVAAEICRNPAEKRKGRALRRRARRWSALTVGGCIIAVLTLTAVKGYHERGVELTPAEPMTIAGSEIIIPIEKLQDGRLHRFNYTAQENIEMRFIVIQKNEAAYGVGLDACDICGPTGYYERKNEVVCRLCDVVMNVSTIGFKGGCNPVPLAYTLREGNMVIEIVNLENERNRFK